jgi:hypothetical protein
MKCLKPALLLLCVSLAPHVLAQNGQVNPYGCQAVNRHDLKTLRGIVEERLKNPLPQDAVSHCRTAELLKRVGDGRAPEYYEKAVKADGSEPAYELFYADYLRNFRGAQRPLFPQAEMHYYAALKKLNRIRERRAWDDETGRRIERGLVALYQRDGLPLLYRKSDAPGGERPVSVPYVFTGSIFGIARLTTGAEAVDDARAFTSEALFASSRQRLNRGLTSDELRGMARAKGQFETLSRIRFRYKELPAVDLLYRHGRIRNAQVTNFFEPDRFNDFRLNEYGVAVEKPFSVADYDLFVRGAYRRIAREGLIEFLPRNDEHLNQFEATAAVSHYAGPDKVTLESTYVFQDINPDIGDPPERNRQIIAATLTYQFFRPIPFLQKVYGQRFETRGLHLLGGYVNDRERFGAVTVRKEDYFLGASLRGLGRFDVTAQPALFRARVTGDLSQSSSQYRTSASVLYRILDEEEEQGIPDRPLKLHPRFLRSIPAKLLGVRPAFIHLVFPFRQDTALGGLKEFENFNVGAELDAKFFTTGERRTTFLTSIRYNRQRFFRLDRSLNLFSFNVGMGF